MKINCIECNNEFEARRNDAKFCSNLCRAKHSNASRKVAQTTPVLGNPTVSPAPAAIPTVFVPPVTNNIDKREDYLIQRIKQLEAEKTALEQTLNDMRIQDALRQNQPEEKKGFLGFGSVKELAEHPLASKLIEQGAPRVIGMLEKFLGTGESTDIFNGLEGEHKDNLHALVEILKPMPPKVTELFLGLAGKASDNPDMFLQGVKESQQANPEVQEQTTNFWMP